MDQLNEPLTERQKQVVLLAAQGYSNKQIAQELCIQEKTVRNYLTEIYRELGLKSRNELMAYAWRKGWVTEVSRNNVHMSYRCHGKSEA